MNNALGKTANGQQVCEGLVAAASLAFTEQGFTGKCLGSAPNV